MTTLTHRLLVVDDEPSIRDLLAASLKFAGFETATAADGNEALRVAARFRPHLVVIDVMLPDLDGFTVLRLLRERMGDLPVVFLTARDDSKDKIQGLTVGGDDYITKPFSLEEVVARIRSVLRRTNPLDTTPNSILRYADLELNEETIEVRRGGQLIELSPTEFKLLRYLMENAERVVSKSQILDHVWQYDWNGEVSIVESYISYLRRKIDGPAAPGSEPLIHTRRGLGYMLKANHQ